MKILPFFYLLSAFILVSSSSGYASQIINFYRQISPDSYVYSNLTRILTSCENNHERITTFMNTSSSVNPKWLSDIYTDSPVPLRLYDVSYFIKYKQLFTITRTEAVVYVVSSQKDDVEFLAYFVGSGIIDRSVALFIVNLSLNGCEVVRPVLMLVSVWLFRTVYFLCSDNKNNIKIYTFNNLTHRVPDKWNLMEEEHRDDSSLLIYERYCHKEDICENLYFDRTKYLDRYNVTIGVYMEERIPIDNHYTYSDIRSNYKHFFKYWIFNMIDPLATFLNTSMILFNLPPKENIASRYFIKFIEGHKLDLVLIDLKMPITDLYNVDYTYPVPYAERRIMTYHWGYKSPIEKICDFYGIWPLLFTLLVLTVVSIVIWHSEGKKSTFVLFEIIRLLIGRSLLTRMRSFSMRCFFGVILIYFLVIQATFNGNLAKFLTKPELRKHINSLEDLQNVDPNVILYPEQYVTSKANHVLIDSIDNCAKYILHNDSSAVCLGDHYAALKAVWKNKNLRVGKKPVCTEYFQDSSISVLPIHERIYKFYIWYVDLGFARILPRRIDLRIELTFRNASKIKLYGGFDPLSINHLTFGFVFLAIGLAIASVCFCIEIVYAKNMLKPIKKYHNNKNEKRCSLFKLLRK